MSIEQNFKELLNQDLQNLNTEVIKLLAQKDKNIPLKTDIENPEFLAFYKTCAVYLDQKGLKDSAKILNSIILYYMLYRVSHKRKGRLEIIEALKTVRDALQSTGNKLLGRE